MKAVLGMPDAAEQIGSVAGRNTNGFGFPDYLQGLFRKTLKGKI